MKYEPVLFRTILAAALQLLLMLGFVTQTEVDGINDGVEALLVALLPLLTILAGILARLKTRSKASLRERGELDNPFRTPSP